MIEATRLTKRYGAKIAVDAMSFSVRPGIVTGFLGPNGAGKSTTMRMAVGLDRPEGGSITIGGRAYGDHPSPLGEVGVLIDAKAVHPGRTARQHLRTLAATHGIGRRRVDEVLGMAGIEAVADRRVGGFSLGMGQRLGIAAALLGDPHTLILDEPVNGLDPEGVLWVRKLTRSLAEEGRTVFLSSHLMSEMAITADHVIVVGRGKVLADAPVDDIVSRGRNTTVTVTSPDSQRLERALARDGAAVVTTDTMTMEVSGVTAEHIGVLAASEGCVLHELHTVRGSLEDAYLQLTADDVEYASTSSRHDSAATAAQTDGEDR